MVKKEHIGTTHFSKILDRNIKIDDNPSDDYYRLIGLAYILEEEKKDEKKKSFKEKVAEKVEAEKNDSDK
jgi:hypothetical protein